MEKLQIEFENTIIYSPTFVSSSQLTSFGITDGAAVIVKSTTVSTPIAANNNTPLSYNNKSNANFVGSIYEVPINAKPEELLAYCEVANARHKLVNTTF